MARKNCRLTASPSDRRIGGGSELDQTLRPLLRGRRGFSPEEPSDSSERPSTPTYFCLCQLLLLCATEIWTNEGELGCTTTAHFIVPQRGINRVLSLLFLLAELKYVDVVKPRVLRLFSTDFLIVCFLRAELLARRLFSTASF